MERIIEVDDRRRLGLGQLGNRSDTRYLAHDNPDGSIVLEPVAVMPASQARFMASADRVQQVTSAIRDARERPEDLIDMTDEIDRLADEAGIGDS